MTPGELLLVEGGTRLRLSHHDGRLEVRTYAGELLDPAAAQVLMALGEKQPDWLPMVRGLVAADVASRGDDEELLTAGRALARRDTVRIEMARTSDSAAVRTALAAYGVHQVVRNPALTAAEWDLLRNHPDPEVARRADAAAETLPEALHDHPDPDTRARVASNPAITPTVIDRLTDDTDVGVQLAAVGNRACPPLALRRVIGRAPADAVRVTLAANPAADLVTLRRCLRDSNPNVRAAAVGNPTLPRRAAIRCLASRSSSVRRGLAGRVDHSLRTLTWLERFSRRDAPYWQSMIRMRIKNHPKASDRLKERIDQLNRYTGSRKGSVPPTPTLRRLARPAPWEALALGLALAVIAVGAADVSVHPSLAVLLLVGGAILLRLGPCLRTVRTDTRVRVSRKTKKVPNGERLSPVIQGTGGESAKAVRGLIRVAWIIGVVVVEVIVNHSSTPTPSFPSGGGMVSLSSPFLAVENDAALPATDATAPTVFADANDLESYLLATWSANVSVRTAYAALEANLVAILSGPHTPTAWNSNARGLLSTMNLVASLGG